MEFPKLFSSDELEDRMYDKPQVTLVAIEPDPRVVIKQHHPHISDKVELLWGTPELHNYLNSLIIDDRHYRTGETRQGFRPEVIAALMKLHQQHSDVIRQRHVELLNRQRIDIWTNSK